MLAYIKLVPCPLVRYGIVTSPSTCMQSTVYASDLSCQLEVVRTECQKIHTL